MMKSLTVIVGGARTRQTDGGTERGAECAVTKLCMLIKYEFNCQLNQRQKIMKTQQGTVNEIDHSKIKDSIVEILKIHVSYRNFTS